MATATAPKPAAPAPKPGAQAITPTKLTTANVGHFLFSPAVTKQIALALPHHLKPERMIRMALTTVRRTPTLLDCEPMSLVAGIVQASELGLELSGPLGQAYLIPRKNRGRMEATFQIGYRGFLRLAYNTGQVAVFNARCVEAGDEFRFVQGSENFVEHRPRESEGPAPITHFYAILRQKGQGSHDGDCEVWPVEKMNRHRDRFRSDKSLVTRDKNYRGVWDTDFEAMGCKTLIRMISKRANLSADLMSLAARDEYAELGLPTFNMPAEFTNGNGTGNGDGKPHAPAPAGDAANPDVLDEIDMHLQRTGIMADPDALAAFYGKFTRGKDGEIDDATGAAMLKELNALPDVTATA